MRTLMRPEKAEEILKNMRQNLDRVHDCAVIDRRI